MDRTNTEINLPRITRIQFEWLYALLQRIHRLTPWPSTGAIIAFLFSQFFSILAFLLPLKAILLLASEGVPWYLSGMVTAETKDSLVIGIAVAAIVSYVLHLAGDHLQSKAVRHGSERIVGKGNKLYLFNDQDSLARDGYRRVCELVGALVIVGLGFVLGGYINLFLFASFALLVVVQYIALYVLLKAKTNLGQRVRQLITDKLGPVCTVLATSSFLIGFAILFFQFMVTEQRNIIVAILSIILLRQLTQRMSIGVRDLAFLANNRPRLNSLFYTSVPYTPLKKQYSVHSVLSISSRNHLLSSALETILGRTVESLASAWLDSGMPGVAYFEVDVSFADSVQEDGMRRNEGERYLVKCYDKMRALGAAHEIHLFTAMSPHVPVAPVFLGDAFIGETRILAFEGLPPQQVVEGTWKEVGPVALFKLWSVRPDDELLDAYLRTHPTITTRLGIERLEQMRVAADDKVDSDTVQDFLGVWENIREQVESLPLVVDNPGLTPSFCRIDKHGEVCCFSWNRWRIEPVGCSNVIANKQEEQLQKIVESLDPNDVPTGASSRELLMVSKLFVLESALNRNCLREAIGVAAAIVELVKHAPVVDDTGGVMYVES